MPDTGCEEYLRNVIDIDKLLTDEELIENLEHIIEDHKFQRRVNLLREKDLPDSHVLDAQILVDLPLFQHLNPERRKKIKDKF
jgi:hypothetical protein